MTRWERYFSDDRRSHTKSRVLLEEATFAYVDRYTALGIPYPDPETMCKGQCEGTGWVPVYKDDPDSKFRKAWEEAEKENPSDDGWHFVKCPDCGGTGLSREVTEMAAENPWEEDYLKYLNTHQEYLRDAGKLIGVDHALIDSHDDSKWSEEEFAASARWHEGDRKNPEGYARAWLHHIHNNPHHWQHWMFSDDFDLDGAGIEDGAIPVPECYVKEMVADWMSSSMTFTGSWDMTEWLKENLPDMNLHSETKRILAEVLSSIGYKEIADEYLF